jgi:hypothetical protein
LDGRAQQLLRESLHKVQGLELEQQLEQELEVELQSVVREEFLTYRALELEQEQGSSRQRPQCVPQHFTQHHTHELRHLQPHPPHDRQHFPHDPQQN